MPKLKAYVAMDFFRSGKQSIEILEMLMEQKKAKKENYIAFGEIIGVGISTDTKIVKGKLPDGTETEGPSTMIVGEFEATNYATGEVREAVGVYLPKYFSAMIEGILKSNSDAQFHIEIGAELSGRNIPWSWVVTNKLKPAADSAIARLKQRSIDQGNKGKLLQIAS